MLGRAWPFGSIWRREEAGRANPPPPSRCANAASSQPPRRNRGNGSACASLVVHVPGKKKKVVVRARPTRTHRGLLNFPPPSSAQWPSGSRAHGWTRLRPKISLAEEGASDLCFAHMLTCCLRARTLLPVCGSRRKHKRRGELLPADRRLLISPLK